MRTLSHEEARRVYDRIGARQDTQAFYEFLHRLDPRLVAGCRPIDLLAFLEEGRWKLRHHQPLAPYGLPSEAVVAARLAAAV